MTNASNPNRSTQLMTARPIEVEIARLLLEFALHLQQEENKEEVKEEKEEEHIPVETAGNVQQDNAGLGPL